MTGKRQIVTEGLEELLANSYTLYLKTHNYHWNVTGPMFSTLHRLFEEQYAELALAVDELAERLRALGEHAPGSYQAFSELSRIEDETGRPDARAMIERLLQDQRTVSESARRLVEAAEAIPDQATADLATRRLDVHEKNAWMLGSHLE